MRSWTSLEIEVLRYLGPRVGGGHCAEALNRSYKSVRNQASRQRVRLRRAKSGGTKLGHPDSAVLRRVRELSIAPLCPGCGKRPVTVKRTGVCHICHAEGLKMLHEAEASRLEAQRELWAARSRLQRRRREAALQGAVAGEIESSDPLPEPTTTTS